MWNNWKMISLYYLVGWLTVEWDDGSRNSYRYGTTDSEKEKYDVQVCNEPRILRNEPISSGCQVKRGMKYGSSGIIMICIQELRAKISSVFDIDYFITCSICFMKRNVNDSIIIIDRFTDRELKIYVRY